MRNVNQTVISQYATSPRLVALIGFLDEWISPDADLDAFYDNIWNIDTATGYGLDVWGRIVGIGRTLTVVEGDYLGMEGAGGASGDAFNSGIFYSGKPTTSNFSLTDDAFRQLILAKAAANITNGSAQAINAILMNLLFRNRGNAYVIDHLDMSMTYNFTFSLLPYEVSLVNKIATFMTPTGVSFNVVHP